MVHGSTRLGGSGSVAVDAGAIQSAFERANAVSAARLQTELRKIGDIDTRISGMANSISEVERAHAARLASIEVAYEGAVKALEDIRKERHDEQERSFDGERRKFDEKLNEARAVVDTAVKVNTLLAEGRKRRGDPPDVRYVGLVKARNIEPAVLKALERFLERERAVGADNPLTNIVNSIVTSNVEVVPPEMIEFARQEVNRLLGEINALEERRAKRFRKTDEQFDEQFGPRRRRLEQQHEERLAAENERFGREKITIDALRREQAQLAQSRSEREQKARADFDQRSHQLSSTKQVALRTGNATQFWGLIAQTPELREE